MFTGLIEATGTMRSLQRKGSGMSRLDVESPRWSAALSTGDSVAVQGACLTIVDSSSDRFSVDVLEETLAKTTLGRKRHGDLLNLERAMAVNGRLDGHLVTGHVDGTGKVRKLGSDSRGDQIVQIECAEDLLAGMVPKGSIAVDGISLTISRLEKTFFQVNIIHHTWHHTSLRTLQTGGLVNIETDLIGKYVQRHMDCRGDAQPLTITKLIEAGFE